VPDQKPFPFRLEFPPELPISSRAQEIVDAIQVHPVVVLAGETGSGKTTQIPKLCLAAGRGSRGRIACTQPRRVAALSVSKRVAEEMKVGWGREVGCKVRFEDRTSRDTVVKFLTDGMLLAEVQGDPRLQEYDTIIIDEAHERSLNIDFLLGHLRRLTVERPDLRVVITSATIDTAAFSKAFENAPVIEVSGRTFPVEIIYQPLDEFGDDSAPQSQGAEPSSPRESLHYIDGAIESVRRILGSTASGDVLVFMPAERDIRETIDGLSGDTRGCDVIPLFGRLTNAEQQRVFAPTARRRVIVATNIAETSLTLPGIRYVVDTGLARVSRYVAQSRTRRLPIEAVAQSSANQRAGRAGRVAEGVCVRLYSEKDYDERPRFAQPEIQRANLADVILRMKAFGLGDIERFPFLNQPATKAVRAGYALLEELHAIERDGPGWQLTEVGRELGRLPVDPAVGRMILQAREEKALREVVIIAAGLSIQDPRERPLEQQAAADQAHRRFTHRESDFLTLLLIWESLHDEFEKLSQSKMRRWCKAHFLSYPRMREWRDIHSQLHELLRGRRDLGEGSVWSGAADDQNPAAATAELRADQPAYRAIHRAVLAGLLGNIAIRDDENGGYKGTHDRRPVIFPGSGLFVREEKKPKGGKGAAKPKPRPARSPRWLMSAELMETSRLYARTCAQLDPRWVLDLGAHLVKRTYRDPFWDEAKGRVMVRQRTLMYGLEIDARAVSYGKIKPKEATDIFIREGLVNDTITWPFDFLQHNRAVVAQLENELTRTRDRSVMHLEEAIWRFYAARLIDAGLHVSAVGELIALVKERRPHEPQFLQFTAEDLALGPTAESDVSAFPESVPIHNSVLPLDYRYKPGETDDGVSLEVSPAQLTDLTQADLDWAVPGYLADKVEHYLRALPKDVRRAVMPLAATAREILPALREEESRRGPRPTLVEALALRLSARLKLRISPVVWQDRPLPGHLQVRLVVQDEQGRELAAGRDLDAVREIMSTQQAAVSATVDRKSPKMWRDARAQWETGYLDAWPARDLPESVVIGEADGLPVTAYPGWCADADGCKVKLFRTPQEAADQGQRGLRAFIAHVLRRDLAWMQKDLKAIRAVGPIASSFYAIETLQADALIHLTNWLTDPARVPSRQGQRTAEQFAAAITQAQQDARRGIAELVDQLQTVFTLRQALMVHPTPYPGLTDDVTDLVDTGFLRSVSPERLPHFERYLRGRLARADRWKQNPAKDAERAAAIAPYVAVLAKAPAGPLTERLRWLIEEYRVSLWAQRLGTAEPVSAKKLQQAAAAIPTAGQPPPPPAGKPKPAPTPIAIAPAARKTKSKPLKSLNALGGLFKSPGN
jgi:ATP-dependent helicase HrpA